MSEFIKSKSSSECYNHCFLYVNLKEKMDNEVEKFISKFDISKINLFEEVNRQKQQYLQFKGKSIFRDNKK